VKGERILIPMGSFGTNIPTQKTKKHSLLFESTMCKILNWSGEKIIAVFDTSGLA